MLPADVTDSMDIMNELMEMANYPTDLNNITDLKDFFSKLVLIMSIL